MSPHAHHHDDAGPGGVTHALLVRVVAVLAAIAVIGIALLWPRGDHALPEPDTGQQTELVDATLVDVQELGASDPTGMLPGAREVEITARLDDTGEVVTFQMSDETGVTFRPGQRVKLAAVEQEGLGTTYLISDLRRDRPLALLLAMFLVAVVSFGRWQGLRALLGLGLSFLLIIGFIVPAILAGRSPVAVALVGSLAIMIITLYLSHGFHAKTSAAVVGTGMALALTAALAAVFVAGAHLTGFTSEEARFANFQVGGLSLRGLLLAGVILGGLGVLDDVTMSQASTVFELHRVNERASFAQLMRGALTVGRDHIAATVNTLFLAYAGASLPLLILFVTSPDTLGTIVTSEVVAVEVVRTLVGSIGLIAAVPLTTVLAAALVLAEERPRRAPRPAAQAEPEADDDDWVDRLRNAYRLDPHAEGGRGDEA